MIFKILQAFFQGKIGQTKVVGCGSSICKNSGGGRVAWEACSQTPTREELKSTKEEIQSTKEETKEEIKSVHRLLIEVYKRLGNLFIWIENLNTEFIFRLFIKCRL